MKARCEAEKKTGRRCESSATAEVEQGGDWYEVCASHADRMVNPRPDLDGEGNIVLVRASNGEDFIYTPVSVRHWGPQP